MSIEFEAPADLAPIQSSDFYEFAYTNYFHQDTLSWQRTQVLFLVEAAALAAAFGEHELVVKIAALLVGSILVLVIWNLIQRDWQVRDQWNGYFKNLHRNVAPRNAGDRILAVPAKSRWYRGLFLTKLIIWGLILLNLSSIAYVAARAVGFWAAPNYFAASPIHATIMNGGKLDVLSICIQIIGLIGLFWYAAEAMKTRKAAQKQVEASLKLIAAATDQVEGMSKPCLTLWGDLRDRADVILEMNNAAGNIVARADQGNYVAQNIGNGVALNVRYRFTRPDHERELRYVPNILATAKVTLVETLGGHNLEHDVTFDYESIGGRKYRTTIHLNHHVMTSFAFREMVQ